jgi:hypothetical protein
MDSRCIRIFVRERIGAVEVLRENDQYSPVGDWSGETDQALEFTQVE